MRPLTAADFPLIALGHSVYRGTESSPLLTVGTIQMATDLALRLNRDDCAFPDQSVMGDTSAFISTRG